MRAIGRFVDDCEGATAMEYGLIAALIALAVIAALRSIGTQLNTGFASVSAQLN